MVADDMQVPAQTVVLTQAIAATARDTRAALDSRIQHCQRPLV